MTKNDPKPPHLQVAPDPPEDGDSMRPREAEGPNGLIYRATDKPGLEIEAAEGNVSAIANFSAEIVARITEHDGQSEEHRLRLRVVAPDRSVHTFDLRPKDFASLGWVDRVPGALLWPPPRKAVVITAIKLLSRPEEIVVRRHLGWLRQGDRWGWLHAGGLLGHEDDGTHVDVEPELVRLELPPPPRGEELAIAARLTLRLLGVGRRRVTVPLLGSALAPALTDPTYGVMLVGRSGTGKSELASLVQGLYGRHITRSSDLKVAWSSSANALEMLAFRAKNHPLVVDDFVVGTASGDEESFDRLLRAQGNAAGRTRMRGPTYYPRGLVISTGEMLPTIRSAVARTLVLRHDEVDWDKLTALQEAADAGVHAATMSGFLLWVAPRKDGVDRWVARRARRVLKSFDIPGVHRRTPPALATVEASLLVFLKYCFEIDAVTEPEADDLLAGVHASLRECLVEQLDVQLVHDPARLLLARIGTALANGRAHLVPVGARGGGPGVRVGWRKDDLAYLDPEPCLELARGLGDAGQLATMTVIDVGARLYERDMLARIDRRGRSTRYQVRVGSRNARVQGWAVPLSGLGARANTDPVRRAPGPPAPIWSEDWFTNA